MINDGTRAAQVVSRMRALVKKSPPRRDSLNINDTIRDVIELIHSEVQRNRILISPALNGAQVHPSHYAIPRGLVSV
jgi:hypothetical protein